MSPATYAREPEGIYRVDAFGRTFLCPPLIILGRRPDPERPTGKLVTVAWADHAETGTWFEAEVPSVILGDAEAIGTILARSGWAPDHEEWFDYLCTAVLENFASEFDDLPVSSSSALAI